MADAIQAASGRTAGVPAVDAVSAERLATLVPALATRAERLMVALHVLGLPVRVTQGRRTLADQQFLYAQGRTRPGDRVTDCDGVLKVSQHQRGRATDFVWKTATGGVTYEGPWELLGMAAEELGLVWGGRWPGRKIDRPHVELPAPMGDED